MSCFRPLNAYRLDSGDVVLSGARNAPTGRRMELPCGRCIGCKLDRARAWSVRITHEAQLYDGNSFVTLDYAPESLPASLSLEYSDFQGFMKRLRRRVQGCGVGPDGRKPVRFFCAGEYGETFKRPHWHAILFNCRMPDAEKYKNGTYRSRLLEDIWGHGNAVIGDVTPQSAAYVAGYTLHKAYERSEDYEDVINTSTGELTARRPEFVTMSRRPGIGAWWYEKYARDLFPHDGAVQDGSRFKVPSYYYKKFREGGDWLTIAEVEEARMKRAMESDPARETPRRRAERELVARARMAQVGRRKH